MCRQIECLLFLRNICCELLRRFGIVAVFPLQFFTQFCEWNFHIPPEKLITMPSGSTRLIFAFLYSFPLIVLKSSASAVDAEQSITIKKRGAFISRLLMVNL